MSRPREGDPECRHREKGTAGMKICGRGCEWGLEGTWKESYGSIECKGSRGDAMETRELFMRGIWSGPKVIRGLIQNRLRSFGTLTNVPVREVQAGTHGTPVGWTETSVEEGR